ncbi:hypothetical protein GALMADRAFT_372482 [Galerina marginata CBS 339.88]|uniref:N-acetyltransferase domain-containing protein n=1 Tax=Galerina marginata (strain CBS 339.88) TaxID=685588 RepID=A0A067TQV8_GALM3|nr:hypothetical protein GALMADRAFT_372482 [Galerina marginata CBS 339.88]
MTPNQLYPLEINPQTQEPFLRLRKHKNIVITPMRQEDAPNFVPVFNDPRVYEWLMRTPFPYTLNAAEDGEDWIRENKPGHEAVLKELNEAQGSDTLKIVDRAPISYIREVQEDGTDIFLGNLSIGRCMHAELMDTDSIDWEHKAEKDAANKKLGVGDPSIVWSFGDYLIPSHHGKGIMTDAIDTLLHEWAIPRMNVRHVLTGAFIGNHGSVKVFEKNGFVMLRNIEEHSVIRDKMRGMHVLEWRFKEGEV